MVPDAYPEQPEGHPNLGLGLPLVLVLVLVLVRIWATQQQLSHTALGRTTPTSVQEELRIHWVQ